MIGRSSTTFGTFLMVFLLVLSGASAATADEYRAPDHLCTSIEGQSVLLILGDNTTIEPGETITFVNGSTFGVVLCGDHGLVPKEDWDLENIQGLTELNSAAEFSRTIKVTAHNMPESSFSFENKIEERDTVRSPTVRTFSGYVVRSKISEGDRIRFESEQRMQRYEAAEAAFLENERRLQNLSEDLDETTPENGTEFSQRVDQLAGETSETVQRLNSSHSMLARVLFKSAANGNVEAVRTQRTVRSRWESRLDKTTNVVEERQDYFASVASKNARTVIQNFLIPLIPGILIGGLASGYYTKRKLKDVAYKRSRTSAVDFQVSQIAGPLVVAGLLLIASVAVLLATIGLDPIVAVIRSLL